MLDKDDLHAIGDIVEAKLEPIYSNLDSMMDAKLEPIYSNLDSMMDAKLEPIYSNLDSMMDAKLEPIYSNLDSMDAKITQQRTEIMHGVTVLMESKFTPQFSLLAEGQQTIIDKLIPISRVEKLEEDVTILKIAVRQLSEDLQQLKKMQ